MDLENCTHISRVTTLDGGRGLSKLSKENVIMSMIFPHEISSEKISFSFYFKRKVLIFTQTMRVDPYLLYRQPLLGVEKKWDLG